MKKLFTLFVAIVVAAIFSLNAQVVKPFGQIAPHLDGPYIFYVNDSIKVVNVDEQGYIVEKTYAELPEDFSFEVVSHDGNSRFEVKLQPQLQRPAGRVPAPDSLIVISDIHGKWTPFISLLKAQKIVDDNLKWNYGKNAVLVIGDIFDRGNDVTTAFWLLYELQREAREAGGMVYVNYGNHEEMVLRGNLSYTYGENALETKYKDFAAKYFGDAKKFGTHTYNAYTELGRWLQACNAVQIVGRDLFVHGGLNQEFNDRAYVLDTVNSIMSRDILKQKDRDAFLFASDKATGGPLWYRGMVPDYIDKGKYTEHSEEPRVLHLPITTLQSMLKRYNIGRIIIGHTEHNHGDGPIAYSDYDYRVVNVDVQTQRAMDDKRGRGLLILKNGKTFIIYDQNAEKAGKPLSVPTGFVLTK